MGVEYLQDEEEWDRFIVEKPEARFVYLTGFKRTVEEIYRLTPFYLLFRKEEKISNVLPLFLLRNLKGERILVSLPFSEYGGLLSREGREEILEEVGRLKRTLRIKGVEIHGGIGLKEKSNHFYYLPLGYYALLELSHIEELERNLQHSVRKNLKKARQWGLRVISGGKEFLKDKFYPLYLLSMKRHGSPPHPLSFFQSLASHLGDYMRLIIVEWKDKPIAGLLGWSLKHTFHITHTVSDHKFWFLRANDLAHWEMIKIAIKEGKKVFDFGPVRYEGQKRYKTKWGVTLFPYYYLYFPPSFTPHPSDPQAPLYRVLSFLWKKTIPLPLTPLLGKPIRKRLGV